MKSSHALLLLLVSLASVTQACFLGAAGTCRLFVGTEDYNFFADPQYSPGDSFVVADSLVEFEQEFASNNIGIFLDIDAGKIRLNIVPIVIASIQNIRINCTLQNGTFSSFRVTDHDFNAAETSFDRNSFEIRIPPTILPRGRRASADFSCSSCEYTSVSSGEWRDSQTWTSTGSVESQTGYPVDNCRAVVSQGHSVSFDNEALKADRNLYIDSIVVDANSQLRVGDTAQEYLLRVHDLTIASTGTMFLLHEGLVMAHRVFNAGLLDAAFASTPRGGLYVTESIDNTGAWQVGYLTLEAKNGISIQGSLPCCDNCLASTINMRAGDYKLQSGSTICSHALHLSDANTVNLLIDGSQPEFTFEAMDIVTEPWGVGQTYIKAGCARLRLEPATDSQTTLRYNAGEDFLQNALVWHVKDLELNSQLSLSLLDSNRDSWFLVQGTLTWGGTITDNGDGMLIGGADARLIVDNSQFTATTSCP